MDWIARQNPMGENMCARMTGAFLFLVMGHVVTGCDGDTNGSGSPLDPDVLPVIDGEWYRPEVTAIWQWQLKGQPFTISEIEEKIEELVS